jgi:predicted transcriptional regulator
LGEKDISKELKEIRGLVEETKKGMVVEFSFELTKRLDNIAKESSTARMRIISQALWVYDIFNTAVFKREDIKLVIISKKDGSTVGEIKFDKNKKQWIM